MSNHTINPNIDYDQIIPHTIIFRNEEIPDEPYIIDPHNTNTTNPIIRTGLSNHFLIHIEGANFSRDMLTDKITKILMLHKRLGFLVAWKSFYEQINSNVEFHRHQSTCLDILQTQNYTQGAMNCIRLLIPPWDLNTLIMECDSLFLLQKRETENFINYIQPN